MERHTPVPSVFCAAVFLIIIYANDCYTTVICTFAFTEVIVHL